LSYEQATHRELENGLLKGADSFGAVQQQVEVLATSFQFSDRA